MKQLFLVILFSFIGYIAQAQHFKAKIVEVISQERGKPMGVQKIEGELDIDSVKNEINITGPYTHHLKVVRLYNTKISKKGKPRETRTYSYELRDNKDKKRKGVLLLFVHPDNDVKGTFMLGKLTSGEDSFVFTDGK